MKTTVLIILCLFSLFLTEVRGNWGMKYLKKVTDKIVPTESAENQTKENNSKSAKRMPPKVNGKAPVLQNPHVKTQTDIAQQKANAIREQAIKDGHDIAVEALAVSSDGYAIKVCNVSSKPLRAFYITINSINSSGPGREFDFFYADVTGEGLQPGATAVMGGTSSMQQNRNTIFLSEDKEYEQEITRASGMIKVKCVTTIVHDGNIGSGIKQEKESELPLYKKILSGTSYNDIIKTVRINHYSTDLLRYQFNHIFCTAQMNKSTIQLTFANNKTNAPLLGPSFMEHITDPGNKLFEIQIDFPEGTSKNDVLNVARKKYGVESEKSYQVRYFPTILSRTLTPRKIVKKIVMETYPAYNFETDDYSVWIWGESKPSEVKVSDLQNDIDLLAFSMKSLLGNWHSEAWQEKDVSEFIKKKNGIEKTSVSMSIRDKKRFSNILSERENIVKNTKKEKALYSQLIEARKKSDASKALDF
jgi:hypothetical protein